MIHYVKSLYDNVHISMYSIISFHVIFIGYFFQNGCLLLYYATTRPTDNIAISRWKSQPSNIKSVSKFIFFGMKEDAGEYHHRFASANITAASLFAAAATELCSRGYSRMKITESINWMYYIQCIFGNGPPEPFQCLDPSWSYYSSHILSIIFDFLIIVAYENIVEYYWHRLMHTKYCYGRFHKHHHHYKSPEPFDDLYIHPLEAIGYYTILYSPPFIFNIHIAAFLAYMVVMGVCGVLDRSGIKFSVHLEYTRYEPES